MEVKTRTNLQMGLPREYVTPVKQRRIKKTALFYLAAHDLDCPARFDVAEVYAEKPGDKSGVQDVAKLYQALEERGYPQTLLEDIFWNNWRRIL